MRQQKVSKMKRSEFHELSNDQQWEFLESLIKGNKPLRPYMPPNATIERCKPDWIGPLYVNIPFPHHPTYDGTKITLDEDNIYNGTLEDDHPVTMRWEGYVSQSRDGELKLSPVHDHHPKPFIEGICDGFNFRFEGTDLKYGVWPGFLCLYNL